MRKVKRKEKVKRKNHLKRLLNPKFCLRDLLVVKE